MATTFVDDFGRVIDTVESSEDKLQAEVRTPEGQKKLYEQTKLYQQGKLDAPQIREMQEGFVALDAKLETSSGIKKTKDIDVTGAKNELTDLSVGAYVKGYEEAVKPAAEKTAPTQTQTSAPPAKAAPSKSPITFKGEDLVMQAQLRLLGHEEVGPLDGRKGVKTNTAMENFAKQNGLAGADEKAVRAKISEQYAALKITPDKINALMNSGNPNDIKAAQVAHNLANPDDKIAVTGRNSEATSAPRARPETQVAQASVAMPVAQTPPTVVAPEYGQPAAQATAQPQGQIQQTSYGTVQQPTMTQEQRQLQEQQRTIERLQDQNNNQKRMIEESRSPQNFEVGRRGTLNEYFNQRSQQMDLRTRQSDQSYDLRSRSMDQRDRQIDMQEVKGLFQMGMQAYRQFNR